MQNNYPRGQVGLLLLVIMGIVVALVMSIASRSLSDTVLSRQERESSAVFSVAETGIENALNSLRGGVVPPPASFQDSTNLVTGNYKVDSLTSYTLHVKELETAQLDLSTYGPPSTLNISWTKTDDTSENPSTCIEGSGNAPAAIEVMAIAGLSNPVTTKFAYYNPHCASLGVGANGFASSGAGSNPYLSSVVYTIPPNTTILRIKPIYSGATISVTGTNLPTQLYVIKSKAVGGDAQKEIEVKRGLSAPASIFDFALFSANTIVK